MPVHQPVEARISWASERCLRIALGDDTSFDAHRRVRAAYERLQGAAIPALRDITPAYAAILLTFDLESLDAPAAQSAVAAAMRGLPTMPERCASRVIEIPVCYEGDCAPDISDVARLHGISVQEVVAIHSSAEYTVHFIGFSPGFAYLGGLAPRLSTPRLDKPRVRVPAGSLGVAGEQTGIYPHATPGGWRLIGRTPLRMFDAAADPPARLAMGDRVRFVPIAFERFREFQDGAA